MHIHSTRIVHDYTRLDHAKDRASGLTIGQHIDALILDAVRTGSELGKVELVYESDEWRMLVDAYESTNGKRPNGFAETGLSTNTSAIND